MTQADTENMLLLIEYNALPNSTNGPGLQKSSNKHSLSLLCRLVPPWPTRGCWLCCKHLGEWFTRNHLKVGLIYLLIETLYLDVVPYYTKESQLGSHVQGQAHGTSNHAAAWNTHSSQHRAWVVSPLLLSQVSADAEGSRWWLMYSM